MPYTEAQLREQFRQAASSLYEANPEALGSEMKPLVDKLYSVEDLYEPSPGLLARLADYQRWCETRAGENASHLMEELAFLAFLSLKGCDPSCMCSYQSSTAQLDLVVSGSSYEWARVLDYLHVTDRARRTMVVECKNADDKVSDAQFSRLCHIVNDMFGAQCDLGIFFTRTGASGFVSCPENGKQPESERQLRDARATQALLHAKHCKYIVVLDDSDITRLGEKGALLRLLEAKVRDVVKAGGIPASSIDGIAVVELPMHLRRHLSPDRQNSR